MEKATRFCHFHDGTKLLLGTGGPRAWIGWYRHSSWFSVLNFKWVAGLIHIPGYPSYDQLSYYECHLCDSPHPREPLSVIAFCTWRLGARAPIVCLPTHVTAPP